MATQSVLFNAVRSVLFAGTLAVSWLAFSAPSGAADTGTDSESVRGTISAAAPVTSAASGTAGRVDSGLGTSVPAVAGFPVPAAPAPRPPTPEVAYPATVPLPPQSVPDDPAGPANVPVIPFSLINGFDPAETVATAVEPARPVIDLALQAVNDAAVPDAALQPVTHLVAAAAGELGTVNPNPVDNVLPPVVDVLLPVVDVVLPVADDAAVPDAALQPVPEPVRDVAPLLVPDFVPGTVRDIAVMVLFAPAVDPGAAASSPGLRSLGPLSSLAPCGFLTGPLSTLLVPAAAGPGFDTETAAGQGSSGSATPEPKPVPISGLGAGSGQSSGGSQTPAAWLSNGFEHLSVPGLVPVHGPLQQIPAPVSFAPGSSPD